MLKNESEKTFQSKVKNKEENFSSLGKNIQTQLIRIIEVDSKVGHEKVSVFAARNGLRTFSLAVRFVFKKRERLLQLKEYGKAEWLGIVWRALIVAWISNRNYSNADIMTAAKSAMDILDFDTPFAAIAFNVAATTVDTGVAMIATDAMDAAILALTATDPTEAIIYSNAIRSDLKKIESSDFSIQDFRQLPLWPDNKTPESILKTNWQSLILDWVSEHSSEKFLFETQLLLKISSDYQALLNGKLTPDAAEKIIRDIADEKPLKDLPSNIDHLGRDQLVKALIPRLSEQDNNQHLTIGLLGDWGIGKSSVIEQLRVKLDELEDSEYIFAEFNAWSYEHTQNLQAGIAHEVISALTTPRASSPLTNKILIGTDVLVVLPILCVFYPCWCLPT